METFIYSLSDPSTGVVRYIGKANDPQQRLRLHKSQAKKKRNHRDCWIFSLIQKGLEPAVNIVDVVPQEEWQKWEKHYIRLYRENGCNLCNATDGGEGTCLKGEQNPFYGKEHSVESRRKMSESLKGRVVWNKGKEGCYTDSTISKMRCSHLGKRLSENHKQKIAKAVTGELHPLYGKTHSESTKHKISATKTTYQVFRHKDGIRECCGSVREATLLLDLTKSQVWKANGRVRDGWLISIEKSEAIG